MEQLKKVGRPRVRTYENILAQNLERQRRYLARKKEKLRVKELIQ